jgi:nitrite reductase/ring-hydroxylating ferredoxin subunit
MKTSPIILLEPVQDADPGRRSFCVHACQTAAALAMGTVLHGCGGGGSPTAPVNPGDDLPIIAGTPSSGNILVTVDANSPLANVGSVASVQSSLGIVLVARTGQTTFSAVTGICTHEQCTITGHINQTYVCPCHGSRYDTSGSVLNGPATRSLQSFPTQFANNVLTIDV